MIIKSLEEQVSDIMLKYLFEIADDDTCLRLMMDVLPLIGEGKNLLVMYDLDTSALSVSYDDTFYGDRKILTLVDGKVIEE